MITHRDTEDAVHATTYHRFMLLVKWAALHLGSVIVFLTAWFASPAGFLGGLVAGIVVFLAGAYAMSHGLAHSSEDAIDGIGR